MKESLSVVESNMIAYIKCNSTFALSDAKVYETLTAELDKTLGYSRLLLKKIQILEMFIESDKHLDDESRDKLMTNLRKFDGRITWFINTSESAKAKISRVGVDTVERANDIKEFACRIRGVLKSWDSRVVAINIPLTTLNTYNKYLLAKGMSFEKELNALIMKNKTMPARTLFNWYKKKINNTLGVLSESEIESNNVERSSLKSIIQSEKTEDRRRLNEFATQSERQRLADEEFKRKTDARNKRVFEQLAEKERQDEIRRKLNMHREELAKEYRTRYKEEGILTIKTANINELIRGLTRLMWRFNYLPEPLSVESRVIEALKDLNNPHIYKIDLRRIFGKLNYYWLRHRTENDPTMYILAYYTDDYFTNMLWWDGDKFSKVIHDLQICSEQSIDAVKLEAFKFMRDMYSNGNRVQVTLYTFSRREWYKTQLKRRGNNKVAWETVATQY